MKFRAKWKIPAMHGDKEFEGQLFERWEDAELDAMDVSYEGVVSWVETILVPGETPPAHPISETNALQWRSSGWWRNLPAHQAALAQARQQRVVMPPEDFLAACTATLGSPPPPNLHPSNLVDLLRSKT